MKTAIFYDTIVSHGGAEKVAIDLATCLSADLITSGFNKTIREFNNLPIKVIDIGNWTYRWNKTISYLLEVPLRFFLNRNRFSYDLYIYSGANSIYSSRKGNKNIWYCHSPNRNLYDLKNQNLIHSSLLKRLLVSAYIKIFTYLDQYVVRNHITKIVTNSKIGKDRVQKYYGRTSTFIYPGIDISRYRFGKIRDFFLAISRLYPAKRMTLIAKAFTRLPQEKLILVGEGPEEKNIREIIKNSPNITLKSGITDRELRELYATCKAVIYIPKDEDFGLVPIEAMASGKISFVSNEGGCVETIEHHKTGFHIRPTEDDLIKKIKKVSAQTLIEMKDVCLKSVYKFDKELFVRKWKEIVGLRL